MNSRHNNRYKYFLILIIILGFVLRIYRLGNIPNGLEWDEVAIGYDAYSILKTGKDQFGHFLPLTFRSLDDYKPPLYEYLTVPSVAIFGLNEFSTRLPSAILGSLSVLMTYLLVKQLFKDNFKNSDKNNLEIIALLASFFLAISPWHLQFSRAAFEVNISVFIVICAVYFFLKGLSSYKYFVFSALFFGLALFSYHSTRVITPLLIVSLLVLNYHKVKLSLIKIIVPLLIYLGFFILFIPILFSKEAQIRLSVTNITNIFNEIEMSQSLETVMKADKLSSSSSLYRLFHGRKPILLRLFISNYLVHYSPQFLFINADVPLHHAPDFGLIYLTELPFIVFGIYIYLKKYMNKTNLVLLIWFLIAPLPAAVTLQVPHAVRSEIFLPTFQIFTALGIYSFIEFLKRYKTFYYTLIPLLIIIFYFDFSKYLHQYYVHIPYELSKEWLYGRKEAALFSESVKNKYNKVIVSIKLQHPHIFFLFYLKYDPIRYLQEGGTYSGGWGDDHNRFDKYEFKYITYEELKTMYPGSIVVGLASEFPKEVNALKTIYFLDGTEAIKIVKI